MKVLAAGNALVRTLGAGPDTSPAQAIVVEGGAGVASEPLSTATVLTPAAGIYLPVFITGLLSTQAPTADQQVISPFVAMYDFTIDQVGLSMAGSVAASTARVLVFDADESGRPTALLAQSDAIDTSGTLGIRAAAMALTFTAGKLYWVGTWTSADPTHRVAAAASCLVLSWTNANPPVAQHTLVRTEAYGGTSTAWVYASSQHSIVFPRHVLLRAA